MAHAATTATPTPVPVAPKAKVAKFVFMALVVLVSMCWFKFSYLPAKEKESNDAKIAAARELEHQKRQQSGEEPLRSCTLPCSMYVGWKPERVGWVENQPLNILYHGMTKPIEVPGTGWKDVSPSEKERQKEEFQPGEAYFASPNNKKMVIGVYAQ